MQRLDRRQFLGLGLALATGAAEGKATAQTQGDFEEIAARTLGPKRRFLPSAVIDTASALSRLPYQPPVNDLPERFRDLDYRRYISIQTQPSAGLFRNDTSGFVIELLHRGFVFTNAVRLFTVEDGIIERVPYRADRFRYGEVGAPDDAADLGFSGFRILVADGDRYVEEAVFQGATYFRALAHGQTLGAMARGLSVRTSEPGGEEFPDFRLFFIEKPSPGSPLVIHAIADSQSLTAAFRFIFRPGNPAFIETEMTVFARSEIANFGIGGIQSTYFFGPNDRQVVDDLRVAAFENDGLQMHRGNGEWLLRPLKNPTNLEISAFVDENPKGFGLMQRQRSFSAFEDDNQSFETRPSVYIEPMGDWGAGAVELIEIPTESDINDNIISYWRPATALKAGESRSFAYRQTWCWSLPDGPAGPIVSQSRSGAGATPEQRRFLVEFSGTALKGVSSDKITTSLTASAGRIISQRLRQSALSGRARLFFELDHAGQTLIELRAVLLIDEKLPSETWLYRWTV